ncbi:hypothetical protein [Mycolicibacterium sp. YH-1]|uniref:hypothetical protein n=1 Tax=Mycolicibacterium sp. YH-1 TaxID=2908837 RepID=UPI001F4BF041|nr:hypothetical protein [Mycolicibacterium sp. YH-1]UNB50127.1 hypothetical protein L0M16_19255 [Mycolicibacterium sp. YH-1]
MPAPADFDRLLAAASLRLKLLGFAELAEAVDDVAAYGRPQDVEMPVVERFRTVAAVTGWETQEETKVDPDWGIARTTLTLKHGKNTIDATIGGRGMHLDHATWRIAGVGYQFHEILAPQRKHHRVDTVLEWMRRVVVEQAPEGEVSL